MIKNKVLMIGSDRKLFDVESLTAKRIASYGQVFSEVHVVVFTLASLGVEKISLAPNVWVYPTNSFCKLAFLRDAMRVGDNIINNNGFNAKDVISSQDPFESGWVGRALSLEYKIPLQIQIHTDLFSPYFASSSILNFIRIKLLAPKIIKSATFFRVVSQKIANDLVSLCKIDENKIDILPIRTDASVFVQNTPQKFKMPFAKNILMVARLENEKNIAMALRVVREIVKEFTQVGLVIVGSGNQEKMLKKMAHDLGIEKKVYFTGFQKDVWSYYNNSQVFLFTSVFEGFGLVLLEASLAKLPIVTTNVGIASMVLGENKQFLCQNELELISALKVVLSDESLAKKIGEDNYLNAQKFVMTEEEYLNKYNLAMTRHL